MNSGLKGSAENESISDNEISEFTNNAVFKGGLGLLSPKKDSPKKEEAPPQKILQNLSKIDPSPTIPNSSIYSSGFLSFRNKKANIQNPNLPTNSGKIEEIDPEIITQSILEKLNSMKHPQHNHKTYHTEQKEIGKLFSNDPNSKKLNEEFEEKVFMNSSSEENKNINNSYSLHDEESEESSGRENNLFWNLNNKIASINENDQNKKNHENIQKEKFINSISCTLSMLEKGKAIFVSKDDMIFVLPSLFVPKNLKVGNTYMFKVSEFENYSKKYKDINEIQEKYVNSN